MKNELIEILREKSYIEGMVKLASGKESDFYINVKTTLLYPRGLFLISQLMLDKIKHREGKIKGVGGMTMGADPLSIGLSLMSRDWTTPLNAFVIRKDVKEYGTQKYIEGLDNFKNEDEVIVLEDVVTTGGSSLKAVQRVREAGLKVNTIFTCVDREEGARETIESEGLELLSLVTRSEIQ